MPIKRLILLAVLLMAPVVAAAAGFRVAVVADESQTSRQLHQLLSGELRQAGVTELPAGAPLKGGGEGASASPGAVAQGDIVVAVGASALRQALQQTGSRQIIVVLITRGALEEELARLPTKSARDIHAIVLDQPFGRYLDLVRQALPQRTRVGLLLGPTSSAQQKSLEKLAAERDMNLSVARVYEDVVFIAQLERLLSQCDVLLALPDVSVHNRNTVQPLLLTTYRAGIPVVAYSEAYAQAGALMALHTTPAQLVRQTVEVVQQLGQGRPVPHIQAPRYFSVSVNGSVARSLGLSVPSAEILRDRLLQGGASGE